MAHVHCEGAFNGFESPSSLEVKIRLIGEWADPSYFIVLFLECFYLCSLAVYVMSESVIDA